MGGVSAKELQTPEPVHATLMAAAVLMNLGMGYNRCQGSEEALPVQRTLPFLMHSATKSPRCSCLQLAF